jgi:hypothetical protein
MRIRWALVFLVALPLFAEDEMRKLDWMVGEWKGDASVQMGPGKPQLAVQTERVQSKLGGKVLIIEGLGKRKLEDGTTGDVVHDALAVISWNEKAKKYRFDAWTARDGYVEAWLEAGENGRCAWGFDTPQGGKVRYTLTHENGQWSEVGEYSRDGSQYTKFFEMTLQKSR